MGTRESFDGTFQRRSDGRPWTETLTVFPEMREPSSRDGARMEILPCGTYLGRYVVLEFLGSGGMGRVYKAYDPDLDRKVALKVLRGDLLGPRAQSRLFREARSMAKLVHPNIVTVYDVGALGEQTFITMELVDGVTLGQWLAAKPRSWREVLRVFSQAGRGLSAAHAAGLVHRDFKPSNVMVGSDDRVRVLDFGLARSFAMNLEQRPPPCELGTPAYMAPERFRGIADAASDQFGFCVALYLALWGEHPFAGETIDERLRNMADGLSRSSARRASCRSQPVVASRSRDLAPGGPCRQWSHHAGAPHAMYNGIHRLPFGLLGQVDQDGPAGSGPCHRSCGDEGGSSSGAGTTAATA